MSIISFEFFLMVAIATIIYWCVPPKFRWTVLLGSSLFFVWYVNEGSIKAIVLMLVMVGVAYLSAVISSDLADDKARKIITIVSVIIEAGLLIILKESAFFLYRLHIDLNKIPFIRLVAPFGMSYFTLSLIGYILDTYWKVQDVERNPFKFLLFGTYFPLLTSGPIVKYCDTGEELIKEHRFSYTKIAFGCQRILWGIFKKLVISERLSIIVTTIYDNPDRYLGLYVWIAVMLFVIQLYTDFSGCLDIIYGVSDIFGIQLPENFDHPFAATNLSEFWRRWHMTLGNWLKEYVFYPIMKSNAMITLSGYLRKKLGKKYGKKVTSCVGLFFSWFLIGFWHGGTMNYIFGVGLWMWFIISLSELLENIFKKISLSLGFNTKCYSWELFQRARTYVLFALGLGFFPAKGFLSGVKLYRAGFWAKNPWILFDGSLLQLGLTAADYNVLVFSMIILVVAGLISLEKKVSLREWISNQNFMFRWMIWIFLFVFTLLCGKYGPGYNAADFIYKGF
ncbi:MBOAT family O-acyltransferase [Butyrivibrio fibrisolvens]|uniref:MBOAT family O-acyltransferase n=1 Tax=Butyrivibrio fibrisolvens TaxID=831 RepID=UPI0003B46703|nr:MBOAT family O-acyltransferase [Butyrivibrio fibrisolvens]